MHETESVDYVVTKMKKSITLYANVINRRKRNKKRLDKGKGIPLDL